MSGNSTSISYQYFWASKECIFIFIALFICYILLIPLFIFVLYLGYQRWWKQRSGSTSETSSHSDIITYNMVAMEIICIFGSCFYLHALFSDQIIMLLVGIYLWAMITNGQVLFHVLTCIERYLAVVHPVTYMRLRQSGGVRIRNVIIGCVWLISVGALGVVSNPINPVLQISFFVLSFIIICFCSFSVLCVLIHPGPGDVRRNRGLVDQSKKRAFQTILIILGALVIRLFGSVFNQIQVRPMYITEFNCVLLWTLGWLSWPSSLVLPLLFLHRVGKLPSCKTNPESG